MHKDEYALSYIVPFGFYILRLTLFDFFEVKWNNSHILKSFVDARTWESIWKYMETNWNGREEKMISSSFKGPSQF